jgi:hypothetical protein
MFASDALQGIGEGGGVPLGRLTDIQNDAVTPDIRSITRRGRASHRRVPGDAPIVRYWFDRSEGAPSRL